MLLNNNNKDIDINDNEEHILFLQFKNECEKYKYLLCESGKKITELKKSLSDIDREKEDIYQLFSKYKKDRLILKESISCLKLEIESYEEFGNDHRLLVQQLSDTQNELEHEQKAFRLYKIDCEQKLERMNNLEKQHKNKSSVSSRHSSRHSQASSLASDG